MTSNIINAKISCTNVIKFISSLFPSFQSNFRNLAKLGEGKLLLKCFSVGHFIDILKHKTKLFGTSFNMFLVISRDFNHFLRPNLFKPSYPIN